MARHKRILIALLLIGVFLLWSVLLFAYGPDRIVAFFGINNSYLLLGILALIGGTSLFFPVPYYLFTVSLGAAGLSPWLLGLVAGTGTLIGDSTTYYLGYRGRELVPGTLAWRMERLLRWSTEKNTLLFPLIAFLYASVALLPDDVIMVPAGVLRYPYLRLAPAVWLGKIIFNTLLAYSGLYGWHLFGT